MEKPPRPIDITARLEKRTQATRKKYSSPQGTAAADVGAVQPGAKVFDANLQATGDVADSPKNTGFLASMENAIEADTGLTKEEEAALGHPAHQVMQTLGVRSCGVMLVLVAAISLIVLVMPVGLSQTKPVYVPYVPPTKTPKDPVADAQAAALVALADQEVMARNAQIALMTAGKQAEWLGLTGVLDDASKDMVNFKATIHQVDSDQTTLVKELDTRSDVVTMWLSKAAGKAKAAAAGEDKTSADAAAVALIAHVAAGTPEIRPSGEPREGPVLGVGLAVLAAAGLALGAMRSRPATGRAGYVPLMA